MGKTKKESMGKKRKKKKKQGEKMYAYNIDFAQGCFDLYLGSRKLV